MGGHGRDLPSITSRAHLLKQERLDWNLSRLVLTHATHLRTRTHAGHLRLHPTLSPCPPAVPAYPRSARRLAKVELFNPQHHHPNPKRRSRLNPSHRRVHRLPIALSLHCDLPTDSDHLAGSEREREHSAGHSRPALVSLSASARTLPDRWLPEHEHDNWCHSPPPNPPHPPTQHRPPPNYRPTPI